MEYNSLLDEEVSFMLIINFLLLLLKFIFYPNFMLHYTHVKKKQTKQKLNMRKIMIRFEKINALRADDFYHRVKNTLNRE